MFTKDLEKIKNKQTEMNNTLGGINSRITEAEAWIKDLEGSMVQIATAEQNIEKGMKKKMKTAKEISGTTLSILTFTLY